MRDYELVMILSPDVDDDGVSAAVDRVSQFVTERGGQVGEVNNWGRRKLAYPIEKHSEGSYVVSQLKLDPLKAVELEANLHLSENIIRHLLVRADE